MQRAERIERLMLAASLAAAFAVLVPCLAAAQDENPIPTYSTKIECKNMGGTPFLTEDQFERYLQVLRSHPPTDCQGRLCSSFGNKGGSLEPKPDEYGPKDREGLSPDFTLIPGLPLKGIPSDDQLRPDDEIYPGDKTRPGYKHYPKDQLYPDGQAPVQEYEPVEKLYQGDKPLTGDTEFPNGKPYLDDQLYPDGKPYPGDKFYPDGKPYPGDHLNPDGKPYPGDHLYPDGKPYPGDHLYPDGKPYPGDNLYPDGKPYPGDNLYPDGKPYPSENLYPDGKPYPGDNLYPDGKPYPGDNLYPDGKPYPGDNSYPDGKPHPGGNFYPDGYRRDIYHPNPKPYPHPKFYKDGKPYSGEVPYPDGTLSTDRPGKPGEPSESPMDGQTTPSDTMYPSRQRSPVPYEEQLRNGDKLRRNIIKLLGNLLHNNLNNLNTNEIRALRNILDALKDNVVFPPNLLPLVKDIIGKNPKEQQQPLFEYLEKILPPEDKCSPTLLKKSCNKASWPVPKEDYDLMNEVDPNVQEPVYTDYDTYMNQLVDDVNDHKVKPSGPLISSILSNMPWDDDQPEVKPAIRHLTKDLMHEKPRDMSSFVPSIDDLVTTYLNDLKPKYQEDPTNTRLINTVVSAVRDLEPVPSIKDTKRMKHILQGDNIIYDTLFKIFDYNHFPKYVKDSRDDLMRAIKDYKIPIDEILEDFNVYEYKSPDALLNTILSTLKNSDQIPNYLKGPINVLKLHSKYMSPKFHTKPKLVIRHTDDITELLEAYDNEVHPEFKTNLRNLINELRKYPKDLTTISYPEGQQPRRFIVPLLQYLMKTEKRLKLPLQNFLRSLTPEGEPQEWYVKAHPAQSFEEIYIPPPTNAPRSSLPIHKRPRRPSIANAVYKTPVKNHQAMVLPNKRQFDTEQTFPAPKRVLPEQNRNHNQYPLLPPKTPMYSHPVEEYGQEVIERPEKEAPGPYPLNIQTNPGMMLSNKMQSSKSNNVKTENKDRKIVFEKQPERKSNYPVQGSEVISGDMFGMNPTYNPGMMPTISPIQFEHPNGAQNANTEYLLNEKPDYLGEVKERSNYESAPLDLQNDSTVRKIRKLKSDRYPNEQRIDGGSDVDDIYKMQSPPKDGNGPVFVNRDQLFVDDDSSSGSSTSSEDKSSLEYNQAEATHVPGTPVSHVKGYNMHLTDNASEHSKDENSMLDVDSNVFLEDGNGKKIVSSKVRALDEDKEVNALTKQDLHLDESGNVVSNTKLKQRGEQQKTNDVSSYNSMVDDPNRGVTISQQSVSNKQMSASEFKHQMSQVHSGRPRPSYYGNNDNASGFTMATY